MTSLLMTSVWDFEFLLIAAFNIAIIILFTLKWILHIARAEEYACRRKYQTSILAENTRRPNGKCKNQGHFSKFSKMLFSYTE